MGAFCVGEIAWWQYFLGPGVHPVLFNAVSLVENYFVQERYRMPRLLDGSDATLAHSEVSSQTLLFPD